MERPGQPTHEDILAALLKQSEVTAEWRDKTEARMQKIEDTNLRILDEIKRNTEITSAVSDGLAWLRTSKAIVGWISAILVGVGSVWLAAKEILKP